MADENSDEDEGPTPNKMPRTVRAKDQQKRLIVVLENASLETVKVRERTFCLTFTKKFCFLEAKIQWSLYTPYM